MSIFYYRLFVFAAWEKITPVGVATIGTLVEATKWVEKNLYIYLDLKWAFPKAVVGPDKPGL